MKALNRTVMMNQDMSKAMMKEALDRFDEKADKILQSVENQKRKEHSEAPKSRKKKLLFVGDSLSRNLNISVIKNVTDMNVKRAEAFIVAKDDPKARFPDKNFIEVVPKELEQDDYSVLVLQGGTNEVTNLDVSGNVSEKIEALKDEIKTSSVKMFEVAQKSLAQNKNLEKVIILKRIFRCDLPKDDPSQIKSRLSEFGNRVLEDIYLSKGCPSNISITNQPLECQGDLRVARYGYPTSRNYDGVHMRGKQAVQHYTGSIVNVLLETLPNINSQPGSYANVTKNTPQPRSQPGHTSSAPLFMRPGPVLPAGTNAKNTNFNFSVSGN